MTTMMIDIVRNLRAIAKATPQAAPIVRDINNKMRELERVIMETATPGEPQAPPT